MAFGWMRQPKRIGLDIKAHGFHYIVASTHREWLVEQAGFMPFKEALPALGKGRYWEYLGLGLAECAERLSLKGVPTVLCLPMEMAKIQTMSLPSSLSQKELEMDIRLALQRELPGLQEPLAIDFSVLSEQAGQVNVFVAAIREAYVHQLITCTANAGWQLKIVDIDVFAIQRVMLRWVPELFIHEGFVAVISVGGGGGLFCLLDSERVIFHQRWANRQDVALVDQIKQGLQQGKSKIGNESIRQFMLCGDMPLLKELAREIEQECGGRVAFLENTKNIVFSSNIDKAFFEAHQADFLPCVGALMRELPPW